MSEWTSLGMGYVGGTALQWGERILFGNDLGRAETKRAIVVAEILTSLAAVGLTYNLIRTGNIVGAMAGVGFLASRFNWAMPE